MTEDAATTGTTGGTAPRCAECGERIAPGRVPGTWTHKARLVAACDLDGDHRARPRDDARAPDAPPEGA